MSCLLPTVVVIGAGPSGLCALRHIRAQRGVAGRVILLDASATIGGTFANKTYDRETPYETKLVSSKFITAFSDFRMPSDAPDHPTTEDYVAYLHRYCNRFGLWRDIRLGRTVSEVIRRGETYLVKHRRTAGGEEQQEEILADAVCVCSGLHNIPRVPQIPGLAGFKGQAIHSSQYRSYSMFKGKCVLVVGCGETGLDIAYRAVVAPAASVALLVRRGFLSVPAEGAGEGLPLDTMITNFAESSYVHPWAERLKLRWRFTTQFIRVGFWLSTGTAVGFNQYAGGLPLKDVQRGHHIINKSTKALPYLNRAAKRRSAWAKKMSTWADLIQDPTFLDGGASRPDIDCLRNAGIRCVRENGTTVEFKDGTSANFDVIVFATGYKQEFPFLKIASGQAAMEDDDPLPEEHNICNSDEPRLAFFGFVRPNVGAIPPMSELQIFWWVQRIRGLITGPLRRPRSYGLLGGHCARTSAYGCDYGLYMHDLARDIGAVPDVYKWLFKSYRVAVAYALGQAYIGFFRLDGPFAMKEAQEVAENELWQPVANRSWATNALFAALAVLFGGISGCCWAAEKVLACFARKNTPPHFSRKRST